MSSRRNKKRLNLYPFVKITVYDKGTFQHTKHVAQPFHDVKMSLTYYLVWI